MRQEAPDRVDGYSGRDKYCSGGSEARRYRCSQPTTDSPAPFSLDTSALGRNHQAGRCGGGLAEGWG